MKGLGYSKIVVARSNGWYALRFLRPLALPFMHSRECLPNFFFARKLQLRSTYQIKMINNVFNDYLDVPGSPSNKEIILLKISKSIR